MNANLVLLGKKGTQKIIPISSEVTVLGRRRNCDLRIPLDNISRRHCQLSVEEMNFVVRDLGSSNGTYVNGHKVEEESLKAGDTIRIGPVTFALQIDGQPTRMAPLTDPDATDVAPPAALDDTFQAGGLTDTTGSGGFGDLDELDLDDLNLDNL